MNVRKSTLFLLVILTMGMWYFMRLASRLNSDLFATAINYLILACVIVVGDTRYRRLVNPISLLAPLMLAFVYYGLMISSRQDPLVPTAIAAYYIFVFAYVAGCLIPWRPRAISSADIPRYRQRVANTLLLIAFLVFSVEAALSGGFPLLTMLIYHVDSYADMKLIPIAHYFVMLTALLPAMYYYSYKDGLISRRHLILFSLCAAFILLNSLSRQLMIFGVIAFYFAYSKLNSVNEGRFVTTTVLLATCLFLGVGEFRIGAIDSSISSLDYLKAFSDVPLALPVNTFEVTYNLYTSLNFHTLSSLIHQSDSFYFGAYTFRPILELSQINSIFDSGIPEGRDTFKMLATVIADPYMDFGLPGVSVFGFVYGLLGSYAFSAYMSRRNVGHTLLWSTFAYVMVMAVFTNFFNVLFIWLCMGLCWVLVAQPGRK